MKRFTTALIAALFVAGCSSVQQGTTPAMPPSQEISNAITQGQARLAAEIYPELADAAKLNDNLFISPLSLSEGLGLALIGARGQTESELRALLGWSAPSQPEMQVREYDQFLTQTGDEKVQLSVANSIWLSDELTFEPGYLEATREGLGASAEKLDFGGDPTGSAERINGWVSEQTRERIPKIVDATGFNDFTAAVLTNAVWFKADWSVPFEDGRTGEFTRGDGSKLDIYMMERIAPMGYRETRDGQAVSLPYGNDGRFVMEVYLPKDAATLRRWERNLNAMSLNAGSQASGAEFDLRSAEEQEILLRLPRFEARFDQSVKSELIEAGIPCAFTADCADFAGMAPGPLRIDDVVHATFLRVDEEGTEAAAVTAVEIIVTGSRMMPDVPHMIVDRPFLMAIRDRASGALIFFGRIADPTPVEKSQ